MARPKVVIVGAGPAGGACALALAKRGRAEVLVIDKSTYPRVKVCGSGLSPHGLDMLRKLGLDERFAPMHVPMSRLVARAPGGTEVTLAGSKGAWVVPRVELDYGIVSEAVRHGATLQEDTKATEIVRDDSGRARGVKTTQGTILADLVVCANGSPSRFSRDESTPYAIRTIMGWWKGSSVPEHTGIMVWDRRLDGYYAWLFPEPGGVVNVGLTIPEGAAAGAHLKELFNELLAEHFADELRGADQVGKWMGHPATLTTRLGDLAESHLMFIGEAARLVMPATVEGISFAMESGIVAASVIDRHFDRERGLSRAQRELYRARTAARMLPKFWIGEGFVRYMRSESARKWTRRFINPDRFANLAAKVVGEKHDRQQ